jgi:lipoprotein
MKLKTFLVCALSLFILTSCDSYYEDPDVVNANREAVTDISGSVADSALTSTSEIAADSTESIDTVDDNNPSSENNLFGIDRQHDVTVNGEVITLQTSYKIPKSRIDNYLYTIPTGIELAVKVLNFPNDRYTVKISNLYTDVSILSNITRFSGLRQDSMNLNFTALPSGGYDIDQENSFSQLFQAEGVNQSQMFINGWYGYGYGSSSTSYSYLSENDVRKVSIGAILQPVWTISITDTKTNRIYATYISDKILMKNKAYIPDDEYRKKTSDNS